LTKKIIIAIDGYSSTGKSTLALMLSSYLGYQHINTGAMYRAVTLHAIRNNWIDCSLNYIKNKDLIRNNVSSLTNTAYSTEVLITSVSYVVVNISRITSNWIL